MSQTALVPYRGQTNSLSMKESGATGSNQALAGSSSPKEGQLGWVKRQLQGRQPENEKTLKAGKRNVSKQDKIILIVGGTGTGKSMFINALGCNRKRGVGHSLHSQTRHVSLYRPKFNQVSGEDGTQGKGQHEFTRAEESQQGQDISTKGKPQSETSRKGRLVSVHRSKEASSHSGSESNIVVVDTPGFGDTKRSEVEIIQHIVSWLAKLDQQGFQLSGILFFHRITDNRITGSSLKSFELFREMAGEAALQKTIFVTSMWDKALAEADLQPILSREAELKTIFWGKDIGRMERFTPTPENAKRIVDSFEETQGFRTEIVLEVTERKIAFAHTKVGRRIADIANRAKAEHRLNMEAVEHESRRVAGDPAKMAIWDAEQKRLEGEVEKIEKEQEQLYSSNTGSLSKDELGRKASRKFWTGYRSKAQ